MISPHEKARRARSAMRCLQSHFITALEDEGIRRDVANNILRDARATLRHGPGSTSCGRLLTVLRGMGARMEGGAAPAIILRGDRRVLIPVERSPRRSS